MAAPFRLNEKVTVERKTTQRDPDYGTEIPGSDGWEVVAARVWANVQDVLPSRAEKTSNGLQIGSQQARVRVRKQHQVTLAMRVTLHNRGDKVMQVIAGPALLDDRMHIEFMAEGHTSG